MLSTLLLPLLLGLQASHVSPAARELPRAVLTNEEQVYFEREAGRTPPSWVGYMIIRENGETLRQPVDQFGAEMGQPVAARDGDVWSDNGQAVTTIVDGQRIELRSANPFVCWVSVRRHADRANGEADWSFDSRLVIHDQGGRVLVHPEGAPPVVIRMRNVVWPAPSTNRPSLVLYVHRPETPDRAESYSWADPDARMVGINLRWMQASCSRTETAP